MLRLAIVTVAVLLIALVLGLWLRGHPDARPDPAPEAAPLPTFSAEVELGAAGMQPYRLRVPKNHRVRLLIHADVEASAGILTVSGYADRIEAIGIGPGLAREITFVSDRPGDDFGFLLGDDLVGRLEVTGSHLERGHE